MSKYVSVKKEKKKLKIKIHEFLNNSQFEIEVVEEIAKAIDEDIIEIIEIKIIRGIENVNNCK